MSSPEIGELYRLVRELTASWSEAQIETTRRFGAIDEKLARIDERITAKRDCPSPGACIDLQRQVVEHERAFSEIRGAYRTIMIAAPLVGAIVGFLASVLAKKMGLL